MSACKFNIPFSGNPDEILNKAKATIEKQGGNFTGDAQAGKFDVSAMGNSIAGSYTVNGNELSIVIDSKPFFIPCDMVEGFLKSKLV
jgi:hypothetical protein